jgi:hypothetical protein
MTPPQTSFRWSLLVALLLLVLPSSAVADTLTGRVINQTRSRAEPGCAVSLVQHGTDAALLDRDTTDSEGRFLLDAPEQEAPLLLMAVYQGVEYLHPVSSDTVSSIQVPVYDTTRADTSVTITSRHLIIDAGASEVTQVLVLHNSGNHTLVSHEGTGLEVPLPEGITAITQGSQGAHTHGNLVVTPQPVKPGASQVMFVHPAPDDGRLIQHIKYPTRALDLLVFPSQTSVTESSLSDLGEIDTPDGRKFRRFSGSAMKPGDRIVLQIDTSAGKWPLPEYLIGILGALPIAFVLLVLFFKSRSRQAEPAREDRSDLLSRRDGLLREIADLDSRYDDGHIAETEYRSRRTELKADAIELTRLLDD